MSYEKVWVIRDKQDAPRVVGDLLSWVDRWDFNHALVIKPGKYTNPRSLSQNALVHTWFNAMAKHFSKKVQVDAEQMKLLMKNKFLGTEDIVIRNTVIKDQLRSTSKLDKGEMTHFMNQVYDWAVDHGVTLPMPADSEYMKLREAQHV